MELKGKKRKVEKTPLPPTHIRGGKDICTTLPTLWMVHMVAPPILKRTGRLVFSAKDPPEKARKKRKISGYGCGKSSVVKIYHVDVRRGDSGGVGKNIERNFALS